MELWFHDGVQVYELRYVPCNQAKIQKELLTSKALVRLKIFHVIHNLKTRTKHGKTSSLEKKIGGPEVTE